MPAARPSGVFMSVRIARVFTPHSLPERNHRFGEFAGIRLGLHERGAAEFHVEHERVEAFGEFFGKNGRGDERELGTVPETSRSA